MLCFKLTLTAKRSKVATGFYSNRNNILRYNQYSDIKKYSDDSYAI